MLWFACCMLYDFQGRAVSDIYLFLEHSVHLKYSLNNANNKQKYAIWPRWLFFITIAT